MKKWLHEHEDIPADDKTKVKAHADIPADDKKTVKASDEPDWDWDDTDYEDEDEDYVTYDEVENDFVPTEEEVMKELGLYLDFSSIRNGHGPVFIYSDPDHECNSDMWDGDEEAYIDRLDYSDYTSDIEAEVLQYPKDEWRDRYKTYLQGLSN